MYLFNGDEYLNKPNVQTTTGIVLVSTSAGCTVQMLMHRNGICTRRFINNTWGAWQSYVTNSDLQLDTYSIPKPSNDNIFTYDIFAFNIIKSGHIVTIQINFSGSMVAINPMQTLFTIPEKYRPPLNLIQNYINQQGDAMVLELTTAGQFQLSNMNKATNGWVCRQCITYITDK